MLADRIRRPDGVTESWQSPDGVPLAHRGRVAALAVDRPGRRAHAQRAPGAAHLRLARRRRDPGLRQDALYALANTSGFVAPAGRRPRAPTSPPGSSASTAASPTAPTRARSSTSSTPTTASSACRSTRGSPRCSSSPAGPTTSSPSGRACASTTCCARRARRAPVALQLGDLGHSRAANHSADIAAFNAQGLAFFEARLKHVRQGPRARQRDRLHPDLPEDRHPRRRPATARRRSRRWPAASSSSATRPPSA